MYRRRYLLHWVHDNINGRDIWVMERRGKLSSADIKDLEYTLSHKWELRSPVTITNFVLIN